VKTSSVAFMVLLNQMECSALRWEEWEMWLRYGAAFPKCFVWSSRLSRLVLVSQIPMTKMY